MDTLIRFLLHPQTAFAHERWFLDDQKLQVLKTAPPQMSEVPDAVYFWTFATATLLFFLAVALDLHLAKNKYAKNLANNLSKHTSWIAPIVRVTTGFVLIFSALESRIFAPDLRPVFPLLIAIEMLVGLCLLVGFMTRGASLVGILLYLSALIVLPVTDVLQYAVFAGIFIYLLITGDEAVPGQKHWWPFRHKSILKFFEKYRAYALPIARIFFGFSLAFVALMNKLIFPQFATAFLEIQPANFMSFLGVSNGCFVLIAGLVELLLGLLIVLGCLPRMVGFMLIFSFTITLLAFGPLELVGHLPLYALAFALLVNGAREKLSLTFG